MHRTWSGRQLFPISGFLGSQQKVEYEILYIALELTAHGPEEHTREHALRETGIEADLS